MIVVVLAILTAILLPVLSVIREQMRVSEARSTMRSLTLAIDSYKADFGEFPPDDSPSKNGSEIIWYYLCRRLDSDAAHHGPYLEAEKSQLVDAGGGRKKFVSPLGNDYHYVVLLDGAQRRDYVLVDPGQDRLLGGELSSTRGFTATNGDENKDGIPDDKDNIYSSTQTVKSQSGKK